MTTFLKLAAAAAFAMTSGAAQACGMGNHDKPHATMAAPQQSHAAQGELLVLAAMTGDLMIDGAWTRATPPHAKVAGGFLVVTNKGAAEDRLIGGSVSFAERVEVHEMTMENDVMKMRPLAEGLAVPAGGSVELKPGGYHIMFMGLKQPLTEGETVDVTLTFEKAGDVSVSFKVEAIGAKGMHMQGHGHGQMHTN